MVRAILVTGATGKQGGAVINALLKANADFEILALTRNTNSPSAQKLVQKSTKVKLVSGNLDAVPDIFQKAKEASKLPIWGVFSVQLAIGDGANPQKEQSQGKALIDESIKNGVKHFVYSSVDRGGAKSDDDPTTVPHFISKYHVEKHLFEKAAGSGMDWTVLRPVAFFENLVPGFFGKVFTTSCDIGFFAAEAFLKPGQYKNQKISLAGDELRYDQFKSVFEKTTGETLPTTFGLIAKFINYMVKDLGYMYNWFRDFGYGADIQSLKKVNPELKDFKAWLEIESAWKTR